MKMRDSSNTSDCRIKGSDTSVSATYWGTLAIFVLYAIFRSLGKIGDIPDLLKIFGIVLYLTITITQYIYFTNKNHDFSKTNNLFLGYNNNDDRLFGFDWLPNSVLSNVRDFLIMF